MEMAKIVNGNGKRGRKPFSIDKQVLQAAIYKVESEAKPTTHGLLWQLVTTELGATVNPQTIKNAAINYGCEVQTSKGKRGNSPAFLASARQKGPRGPRTKNKISNENIDAYLEKVPDRAKTDRLFTLLEKAQEGSTKAAIRANCIQCSNFQLVEVRNCAVNSCIWHSRRPYQGKNGLSVLQTDLDEFVAERELVTIGG